MARMPEETSNQMQAAKAEPEKEADKDPPYLAELIAEVMAAYPSLTKERAREMIKAFT